MRLGLMVGYSGSQISIDIELVKEAERCGFDSVWTAEAWGSDAVTPLAWIGAQTSKIRLGTAIMQLPGRTPANTAMTAMTLDQLSGGRFILGLGTSGPQVVEGWHGVPYDKPLTWMREYIEIVRAIFAREKPSPTTGCATRSPTAAPARRVSASRSRASSTAARTCPSTPARWPRRARRSPPRSPTACSSS